MKPLSCLECPLVLLDNYLWSPEGKRLERALDVDFALRSGFTVTLDEVNYWEFTVLKILAEERGRLERDQIEEARRKHGR
jgi:hypothetical protein